MNYLYSILGVSAFFFVLLTLIDWETRKRDARQRAEWDKQWDEKYKRIKPIDTYTFWN